MIITLKGCTATAFIGGLNFFKVSKGTVSGADVTISTSTINKDEATSTSAREIATVALKSNYENLVVTVTMGGTTVNWYADGKVTIPANTTVTGDIKISASATAVVPDVPVTPTMYTFTINPTPTTATVTLTASGYSQSGNSIEVPANTVVTWKVSASGYTEQNGTHTVTKTESKSVVLSEVVNPDEPITGEYWVSEQLVDTKVGSGIPSSFLNTQYFYITDENYLSILRNKTIKSIAIGTGSKEVSSSIILSLVPLSDTKPTTWEDITTIPVNNTTETFNTVMIFDLPETVTVPDGYTIGYRSLKGGIFGGGTINGSYKRDEYYYNTATAETSTKITTCPIDFKVEG